MRKPITTFLPWGSELTWADTDIYEGKVLYLATGKSKPLPNIIQNLYVSKGEGVVVVSNTSESDVPDGSDTEFSLSISEGQIFVPNPKMNHIIKAYTDMTVLYVAAKM